MFVRAASTGDVSTVVDMAHVMKRRLAEWSPVYFRPRQGSEERHAAYLAFLVSSSRHDTRVLVASNDEVVGFLVVLGQAEHHWVDDLYLADHVQWGQAARLLVDELSAPWVTCVSCFDAERTAALQAAGLEVVSTYWARTIVGYRSGRTVPAVRPLHPRGDGPRHTFSGGVLDPAAPGALVVADDNAGYVIGSAGMEPPLYDPGGPACIVDRIHGTDRRGLLDAAIGAAATRGDVGMVVVCDTHDHALAEILSQTGFRSEVNLVGCL
jgi:hypothetical protein